MTGLLLDKIRVRIAPGADLAADPDTWTFEAITEYVRYANRVHVEKGKRNEGNGTTTSILRLRVDNTDGRFARLNPTGPWFGELSRNTPIIVEIEDDSVWHERFAGFGSFQPRWNEQGKADAFAEVVAYGLLHRMKQGEQPLNSAIFRSVQRAPNVVAYWPMEDGSDAESFASPIDGVSPMSFNGDVSLAGQDPPAGSKPLPIFQEGSSFSGPIPAFTLGTDGDGNSWRADWAFRMDEAAASVRTMLKFRMADSVNHSIRLRVSDTTFQVQIRDDEGGVVVTDDETVHPDFFGQWLHVWLRIQGSGELTYRAQVRDSTQILHDVIGITGSTPPKRPTSVGIGTMFGDRRVGHVTISDQLSSNAFENGVVDGYTGEPAATRFERLCEEEGLRCELIAPELVALNDNTGFEVDTSGWDDAFGTLTRSTAQAFEGVASGLLEPSGGNPVVDAFTVSSVRVRPGTIYQWSAWVFSPDGWHDVQLLIEWRNSNLTSIGTVISDAHVVPAGVWTQLTLIGSPSLEELDARFVTAYVRLADTPTVTDVIYIDEAVFAVADTSMPMGPQRPTALTGLFDEIVVADQGELSEAGFGLTYRTHTSLYRQDAALEIPADGLFRPPHPADDTQQLRNDITGNLIDGTSVRAVDNDSIKGEGRFETAPTFNVNSVDWLRQLVHYRLHLGTLDEYRWPKLNFALHRNEDLIAEWLAARQGDRVTAEHSFDQLDGVDIDQLVVGWSEVFDQFEWEVTLNCRPASPVNEVGVFDTARFDTAGSETDGSFDAGTDTSLTVISTGQPWINSTDHSGEFPFEIKVSGVVLNVTAISGSTSPQTFTVDQAPVNGIEKTIPDESPVRLATLARFAL